MRRKGSDVSDCCAVTVPSEVAREALRAKERIHLGPSGGASLVRLARPRKEYLVFEWE